MKASFIINVKKVVLIYIKVSWLLLEMDLLGTVDCVYIIGARNNIGAKPAVSRSYFIGKEASRRSSNELQHKRLWFNATLAWAYDTSDIYSSGGPAVPKPKPLKIYLC